MKISYSDMKPIDIRIAILRAGTTQAAIARSVEESDGRSCSRATVGRVIDNKIVSHRIRTAIADAIGIPVEKIWRSYYLNYEPGRRGRRFSKGNQARTAAC